MGNASARSSATSLPGRYSITTISSVLERRSSLRTRRLSDSSIMSDKEVTGMLSFSVNPYVTKRGVMFSPIQEHNEDEILKTVSSEYENCNKDLSSTTEWLECNINSPLDSSDTNTNTIMQFTEEPKAINSYHKYLYKSTEV